MTKTADLCDAHAGKVKAAEPIGFRDFGAIRIFSGKIETVKCFEDNSLVRQALEQRGDGKVLVVDGGGSLRCALVGDILAALGVRNKWNGIIVYGSVRDRAALETLEIGVKALNTIPVKSNKRNEGQANIPVCFAGVEFMPGDFVYADEDGIIVAKEDLSSTPTPR